jgi:hypothetical protein
MRMMALGALLLTSALGGVDLWRTTAELTPAVVDLALLDPKEFALPQLVLLRGKMLTEHARRHEHQVPLGRGNFYTEVRWLVPVVSTSTEENPPVAVLELPDLHFNDGRLALPYSPDATQLKGWLGPARDCWGPQSPEVLSLEHQAPAHDMQTPLAMIILPLLALIGMLLLDRHVASVHARTNRPPPGDFNSSGSAGGSVAEGLLLGVGGLALLLMLCATRLLRLEEVGLLAVSMVIPGGAALLWVGYRYQASGHSLGALGLSTVQGTTGTVTWVPFSNVEGLDFMFQKSELRGLKIYLAGVQTVLVTGEMASPSAMRAIQDALLGRLLPSNLEQWCKDGRVDFGGVTITRTGVVLPTMLGTKEVSFMDLEDVRLDKRSVVFKDKGSLLSTATVDCAQVDETPVFFALLRHVVGRVNPSAAVETGAFRT